MTDETYDPPGTVRYGFTLLENGSALYPAFAERALGNSHWQTPSEKGFFGQDVINSFNLSPEMLQQHANAKAKVEAVIIGNGGVVGNASDCGEYDGCIVLVYTDLPRTAGVTRANIERWCTKCEATYEQLIQRPDFDEHRAYVTAFPVVDHGSSTELE